MVYVERLLAHPEYRKLQQEIKRLEADRIYCRHAFSHSLDVCRIAWILFLEERILSEDEVKKAQLPAENGSGTASAEWLAWKERIYLTGLLHDVGRVAQYQTGEHHGEAGRKVSERLLDEIGCPESWRDEILFVVALHFGRDGERMWQGSLGDYICRADHLSRNCFLCEASDTCKWLEEEKNQTITE